MPFSKTTALHVCYFWHNDVVACLVACPRSKPLSIHPTTSGRGPLIQRHTLVQPRMSGFACHEEEPKDTDGKGDGKGRRRKLEDGPTDDTRPTFVVSGTIDLVAAARTKVTYSWRHRSTIRRRLKESLEFC